MSPPPPCFPSKDGRKKGKKVFLSFFPREGGGQTDSTPPFVSLSLSRETGDSHERTNMEEGEKGRRKMLLCCFFRNSKRKKERRSHEAPLHEATERKEKEKFFFFFLFFFCTHAHVPFFSVLFLFSGKTQQESCV